MFSLPQIPERGELLLVTDELSSPADFVLHADLAAYLKDSSRNARCIVLSVSESLSRWKTIAGKSNLNVPALIDNSSLVFVDIEGELVEASSPLGPGLRPMFDRLTSLLEGEAHQSSNTLLIIDDLSTLEWIGFSTQDLCHFVRALCATCSKTGTSVIIRHHIITPGHPDELLRLLIQLCAYRIDIFPLSTGRSGSVSGQLSLYLGPGHVQRGLRTIPRSKAVLYRLTDAGSTFFERGTGMAVL